MVSLITKYMSKQKIVFIMKPPVGSQEQKINHGLCNDEIKL
jgi:hypothetical protein